MIPGTVTCPRGHPNPAHQHFCGDCGARMAPPELKTIPGTVTCPKGHPNPAHGHFCGECGAPLAAHPKLECWEKRGQWPVAILAVVFITAYSVEVLAQLHGGWFRLSGWVAVPVSGGYAVTWWIQAGATGLFILDYFIRLRLAARAHVFKWWIRDNWFDALILIPWFRPLRVIRAIVMLRTLEKLVGDKFRRKWIAYTVGATLMLVWVFSVMELDAERGHYDSRIETLLDAIWWSITTITTVGYGDYYPVTAMGKLIGVMLMIGAIGLVASITGIFASWILERVAKEDVAENEAATAADIDELRAEIRHLADEQRQHSTALGLSSTDGYSNQWIRRFVEPWRSRRQRALTFREP